MGKTKRQPLTSRFRDTGGQTTSSFLLKIVISVFLVAAIGVEVLSPLVTRVTLENAEDSIVDKASTILAAHEYDVTAAFPELKDQLKQDEEVDLERVEMGPRDPAMPNSPGTVKITVVEKAHSYYIVKLIPATSKYYQVRISFSGSLHT